MFLARQATMARQSVVRFYVGLSPTTMKSAAAAEATAESTAAAETIATAESAATAEAIATTEAAATAEAIRFAARESAEAVIACASRLRLAIRPRIIAARVRPSARRVLLPAAAGVLVDVAVGVGG